MPSSHSALVAAIAHAIGLYVGFETPLFALSLAIAIIVIYDATGIRRQAGQHAEIINAMIRDLAHGHPLKQQQLREVLGHTPLEALAGSSVGVGSGAADLVPVVVKCNTNRMWWGLYLYTQTTAIGRKFFIICSVTE